MIAKKRRLKPDIRRAQIVEVTKELILENGLAWASVIRISEAMGISQATLYYYFENRREILLETLSSIVNEGIAKIMASRTIDNAEDFIRNAASSVYELAFVDIRQTRLFFEYVCASPIENMRDEIQTIFSSAIGLIEIALRQGIREGSFREDIDVSVIAWEIASLGIALYTGIVLQMPNFLSKEQALSAVDHILKRIEEHPRKA